MKAMQLTSYGQRQHVEQQYARVESVILDLQLGISSVSRANGCLDLDTVRQIRARAAKTLDGIDTRLAQFCPDTWQKQRVTDRRRTLAQLLREPAPIERMAQSMRVG
jgi:hypothetical protein